MTETKLFKIAGFTITGNVQPNGQRTISFEDTLKLWPAEGGDRVPMNDPGVIELIQWMGEGTPYEHLDFNDAEARRSALHGPAVKPH